MSKKEIPMQGVETKYEDELTDDIYSLFKIVDKLEQRISTLEKKLEPKSKQLEFNFNQDQPLLVELNN